MKAYALIIATNIKARTLGYIIIQFKWILTEVPKLFILHILAALNFFIFQVPRVFVKENCVGGGSDVKSLYEKGELQKLVS